jgi:hypothetical protein
LTMESNTSSGRTRKYWMRWANGASRLMGYVVSLAITARPHLVYIADPDVLHLYSNIFTTGIWLDTGLH